MAGRLGGRPQPGGRTQSGAVLPRAGGRRPVHGQRGGGPGGGAPDLRRPAVRTAAAAAAAPTGRTDGCARAVVLRLPPGGQCHYPAWCPQGGGERELEPESLQFVTGVLNQDLAAEACAVAGSLGDVLKRLVSSARPSVVLSAQPVARREAQSLQRPPPAPQDPCPPKPPRAHELKLLVKDIQVSILQAAEAPDAPSPRCQLLLSDPRQSFSGTLTKSAAGLGWEEELTFELNAKSKELCLQLSGNQPPAEAPPATATIPLDLFRKQPSGPQSFPLTGGSSEGGPVLGSVTAEFSFLEPCDTKTWRVPTATVERDRTVMPCGTVVTTVTAVKTEPRRASPLCSQSPQRTPVKMRVIEKDIEVQAVTCHHAPISKTLSSSDTELLALSSGDPVAEAAIRQLSQGSGLRLRAPRKKSTLIISGVSKTSLCQDSAGGSAMPDDQDPLDGPPQEDTPAPPAPDPDPAPSEDVTAAPEPPDDELDPWDPEEDPLAVAWGSPAPQHLEGDRLSGSSLSTAESTAPRRHKGGILRRGAKLFRRRPPQKEPGLSQSYSDLALEPPGGTPHRKEATLSRVLHCRLLGRRSGKTANGAPPDPHA
ncbi:C2 domain-containing protein 2 isoform X5 [Erinaceus europaeus]|uniref:C2 domain-containing protein 2 isoform X5 n=1 Tax=Erinaceus europaeus TaxID=9365 RepID=A0ABM3Y0Z4_ERIEU|nr:C2 domain-containing protein 2 isoform X5 [Erinaceus europaeus]